MRLRTCFLLAMLIMTGLAHAAPLTVSIEASTETPLKSSRCLFADDDQTVVIRDGEKTVSVYRLCSSYGTVEVEVVIDAKGLPYLFVQYGEGRGPNAVQKYLAVFHIGPQMDEYFRTPIAGSASAGTRWDYSFTVVKPDSGGLRVLLQRHAPFTLEEGDAYVPSDRERVIQIGI